MLLTFLIIQITVCFIIDVSGFIDHFVHPIAKHILGLPPTSDISIPLIDCSLCVGWWINIITLFVMGFTITGLLEVTIISLISKNISGFEILITDFLSDLEYRLSKLISKG